MKRYTIAQCFSTFALPHILFVQDLEERKKAVMSCCLGWNIGLFPDFGQREQQIDMVWKMVEADNREPPPPGLEKGFKRDLQMLVAQKRDLFPWLMTHIPMVELVRKNSRDVLRIKTERGIEEIELVTRLDPAGLPLIIEVLRDMHKNTEAQVNLMHQARRTPGALNDIFTTQMATAYCVQRADLMGYHRILTVWRATQPAPSVKRVIGHWLGVLDEIERNSQAVLAILTEEQSTEI
jgi:hypothetical protein